VRNNSAGSDAFAPCGIAYEVVDVPKPIVNATTSGSIMVLKVTRNAVALDVGFIRNSTRSAALPPYEADVGYVYVPEKRAKTVAVNSEFVGSGTVPFAP